MSSPHAAARLLQLAKWTIRSEEGQDLIEYGLLAALIAIVAIGTVSVLGQTIYSVFWKSIEVAF